MIYAILDSWLQGNKLHLNVAKTHSMLITTKQKLTVPQDTSLNWELNICESELEVVQKNTLEYKLTAAWIGTNK